MKVLVVDNTIDQPATYGFEMRRYVHELFPDATVLARRAPEMDLPESPIGFSHIIFSGSRNSILDRSPWVVALMAFIRKAFDAGVPMLGICYGHQIIARTAGGDAVVRRSATPEFGWVKIKQTAENPIFKGVKSEFVSFESHFEEVCDLPRGFVATATNERCAIQSYYVEGKWIFGVQFHPERNAHDGEESLLKRRDIIPDGCLFGAGEGPRIYDHSVVMQIFKNFLSGPQT